MSRTPDGRYQFVVQGVTDPFGRDSTLAFGAEDGHVICNAPSWWKSDGTQLQEEAIGSAWSHAVRLARAQRGE
jgi:hypothetical protein